MAGAAALGGPVPPAGADIGWGGAPLPRAVEMADGECNVPAHRGVSTPAAAPQPGFVDQPRLSRGAEAHELTTS
jgi:hypothetical protein